MKIVIDHVSGSRRGQRQELVAEGKLRFGRHPECEVSFDAHKDIDASSRHAELRPQGDDWILVDVGKKREEVTTEAPRGAHGSAPDSTRWHSAPASGGRR